MISKQTRRPLVLGAVIMSMFMGAIEATIVATSMPTIVARLGDMSLYSWVFSSYLLMQVVTVPVYGKLSDLFGRKRVLLFGLAMFIAGSVLCGIAWSMPSLVVFRLIQGIGGGAVVPLAMTLIGDLYPIEERGRVQGYVASVWGVSAIVGPLAGALIVQYVDWSWVFWVNVPFGIVAVFIIATCLHEDVSHRRVQVDYPGAVLLLGGLSSLMLCLTHAGDLGPAGLVVLGLVFVVCAVLFVRQERRAAEPVVNFELWRTPLIAVANATTLLSGVVIAGVVTFVPTFAQGVLGASAIRAGFALSAMSIGWPIATVVAGRLLVRVGARRLARIGGVAVFFGSLVIALAVQFSTGVTLLTLGAVLLGAGMGTISITFMITIQSSVPWTQRGAATASNMLMRMLGNAVGSALFGGLLNVMVQRHLEREGWAGRLGVDDLQQLLGGLPAASGPARTAADPAVLAVLREGLAGGLHWVFWGVCLAGALTLLLAWRSRNLAAPAAEARPAVQAQPSAPSTVVTGTASDDSSAIPLRQG